MHTEHHKKMNKLSPVEALQLAVYHRVCELKSTHPEYQAKPCACGLWSDKPWIYLLVSTPRVLSEGRKRERDKVVLEWAEHMEKCK